MRAVCGCTSCLGPFRDVAGAAGEVLSSGDSAASKAANKVSGNITRAASAVKPAKKSVLDLTRKASTKNITQEVRSYVAGRAGRIEVRKVLYCCTVTNIMIDRLLMLVDGKKFCYHSLLLTYCS